MKKIKDKEIKVKKLKNKLISLYTVITAEDYENLNNNINESPGKFLTITTSYEECEEYIYAREIADHIEHYTMWCNQRELDMKDDTSWELYREKVIGDNSDYMIFQMKLYWEDIIAFMRMFQGCYPIGCSYDRVVERLYFKEQLKDFMEKEASLDDDNYEEYFMKKKENPKNIIQ